MVVLKQPYQDRINFHKMINMILIFLLQCTRMLILFTSEPVSPSEPLLKSPNVLKFCDIIHAEFLSFVYQLF